MNEEEAVGVEGRGQNARDWSDGISVRSQLVRCGQRWGTQRGMDIPPSLFLEEPQFICPFCTQSPSEWDSLLSPSSSAPQLVACPQQQSVVSKELDGVFAVPTSLAHSLCCSPPNPHGRVHCPGTRRQASAGWAAGCTAIVNTGHHFLRQNNEHRWKGRWRAQPIWGRVCEPPLRGHSLKTGIGAL